MNAFCALAGLRGGCTFATVGNSVAALDRRLGAVPLTLDGKEVQPFYCTKHRIGGALLATEPGKEETRLAETVEALRTRLLTATVIAPA